MKKRIIALLLAFALLLGLTGCKKEEDTAKLAFQTAPYYTQEEMPLRVESGELAGCCTDGKSIWYLTIPGEDDAPVLCRVSPDSGEAELLAEYRAPTVDGQSAAGYVGPVLGGDGKLWLWEQFLISQPDSASQVYRIRQLDPDTGGELSAIDITAAMEDMDLLTLSGMAVDGQGTIFLADKKHIAAIDSWGQTLYTLKAKLPGTFFSNGAGGTLALLPDGTVGVLTVLSGDEREVQAIDPETQDWTGKKYPIHKNVGQICSGSGQCAFYYVSGDAVYGSIPGEEIPLRLLGWASAQLSNPGGVKCFALLEEGQAVALSSVHEPGTGQYDDKIQAIRLLPSEEAPEGGKVRLIYGTIGINYIVKEKIQKFNGTNEEYYIELRDYSEGMLSWSGEKNTPVYQNALARLYAEIAAGRCPDILDETVPLERLARQGALEDLWPWIDSDPEISREGLMDHVLECLEVDGKLPQVCAGFEIETAVADVSVAGDRTGWTVEEMLAAFGGEMPEFYFAREDDISLIYTMFHRFDRKSALYYLVNMNLSRFVNMETGECCFDSEDFKSLLQLAGSGETAAESGLDLDDWQVRLDMGLTSSDIAVMSGIESCRVFPWEGKPLLYARTLSEPRDLLVDDVLFGGREPLTDYERRLWDADILFNQGTTEYSDGKELIRTRYFTLNGDWSENGFMNIQRLRYGYSKEKLAPDYVVGGADGNIYASYVGFPTTGGAGSSFTLRQSMAISASCEAKEGAWAFVRRQLLPRANVTGWYTADFGGGPSRYDGFAVNKETFEEQMQAGMEYWTDPYTGEVFLDANGDPVEFTPWGIGVGSPGDIVLMAYLFAPSEVQMDRFWKLYEATEQVSGRNDALLDIVMEEADVYFAGDKTLDETAKLIQNRVQLYVNENR